MMTDQERKAESEAIESEIAYLTSPPAFEYTNKLALARLTAGSNEPSGVEALEQYQIKEAVRRLRMAQYRVLHPMQPAEVAR